MKDWEDELLEQLKFDNCEIPLSLFIERIKSISIVGRYSFILVCLDRFLSKKTVPESLRKTLMHDSSAFFGDLNYPLWYTKIGQLLENEELPAWLDIKSHISEDEYHIAAELLIGAVGLIASELQSPTDPKGYGPKSIDLLIYLILDCLKFNIDSLPSLDWFSSSKFTDNQGWGTSASSKEIAILLSSMSNLDSR